MFPSMDSVKDQLREKWNSRMSRTQPTEATATATAPSVSEAANWEQIAETRMESLLTATDERDRHFRSLQFVREVLDQTAKHLGIENPFLEGFADTVGSIVKAHTKEVADYKSELERRTQTELNITVIANRQAEEITRLTGDQAKRIAELEADKQSSVTLLSEWLKPCFCDERGTCLMCITRKHVAAMKEQP